MYCPSCACELPAVAKFCVRCGALTGFVGAATATKPPVSDTLELAPAGRPDNTSEDAYCGKCGTKTVGGNQFCTRCGNSLHVDGPLGSLSLPTNPSFEAHESGFTPAQSGVHQNSETSPVEESIAAGSVLTPTPTGQDTTFAPLTEPAFTVDSSFVGTAGTAEINPPVVQFVLLALGTMLSISVIAFAVADDIARSGLSIWIPLLFAVFVLPFLLYYDGKTLGTLKRLGGANEAVGQARRGLLKQSIVFGVLFVIIASTIGYFIGVSGSETQRLITDLNKYAEIAKRIGAQRNAAEPNVAAHVAMYDKLEPDVQSYARICSALHDELVVYDGKYPAQHKNTEATLHEVDREANRANLLLQEIKVARAMKYLDVVQQWTFWDSNMKPLLAQEDALN